MNAENGGQKLVFSGRGLKSTFFKRRYFHFFEAALFENGWNYHSAVSFWLVEKFEYCEAHPLEEKEEKMRVWEAKVLSFELKFFIASDLAKDHSSREILPKLLLFWMNISLRFLVLGQFTNRALHSRCWKCIILKRYTWHHPTF